MPPAAKPPYGGHGAHGACLNLLVGLLASTLCPVGLPLTVALVAMNADANAIVPEADVDVEADVDLVDADGDVTGGVEARPPPLMAWDYQHLEDEHSTTDTPGDSTDLTTPETGPDCLNHSPWYMYCDNDDYWTAAMQLALAFGACFVVVAATMIACKTLIRRAGAGSVLAGRRGDGDTDSVSSMQRWINERLRDRPPRYEEMGASVSAPPSVSEPSVRSVPSVAVIASGAVGAESSRHGATPTAIVSEEEKPPPYEIVVAETQIASVNRQIIGANTPPPMYTAMTVVLMGGQGYSNPGFLEDSGEPPPYSPSCSPGSSTLSSTLTSVTSSSSLSSSWSSSPESTPRSTPSTPTNLLTVSQAVAVREMMLASPSPSDGADLLWTSSC